MASPGAVVAPVLKGWALIQEIARNRHDEKDELQAAHAEIKMAHAVLDGKGIEEEDPLGMPLLLATDNLSLLYHEAKGGRDQHMENKKAFKERRLYPYPYRFGWPAHKWCKGSYAPELQRLIDVVDNKLQSLKCGRASLSAERPTTQASDLAKEAHPRPAGGGYVATPAEADPALGGGGYLMTPADPSVFIQEGREVDVKRGDGSWSHGVVCDVLDKKRVIDGIDVDCGCVLVLVPDRASSGKTVKKIIPPKDVQHMIRPRQDPVKVVKNCQRTLDEVVATIATKLQEKGKAPIDLFQNLDVIRDGQLEYRELEKLLRKVKPDLNTEEIHELFEAFDADSGGTVDAQEFCSAFTGHDFRDSLLNWVAYDLKPQNQEMKQVVQERLDKELQELMSEWTQLIGQTAQYYSNNQKKWVPCTVTGPQEDGINVQVRKEWVINQKVLYFSDGQQKWYDGSVIAIDADGNIEVNVVGPGKKIVPANDVARRLKHPTATGSETRTVKKQDLATHLRRTVP